ncbi:MAG: 4-hydroxybenzoate 3-monooxygenase [Silicimonas sp.]|nr:4-hydroxybenzoate 3-monooxygenase [Silicimonas sp.]
MRTQVCIIGGGPSGLLLSQILHRAGIDTVVLERQSRAHVLSRIRAGVLEEGSTSVLRKAGVDTRMDREKIRHEGTLLSARNRSFRVDFTQHTGKAVYVYGQTEVTADLYAARDAMGGVIIDSVSNVMPHDLEGETPFVTYEKDDTEHRINCDLVVGCDGFHGVSRQQIPTSVRREYERAYPFGWLGVLSETPPVSHELIYANHSRGFALCSQRNDALSRYYIQCDVTDKPDAWSDEMFWDELRRRIPDDTADALVTGASIEKSVAPLRSFVSEPMQWGKLFLVGDAAHIVPPTGAKGLNLAISDVHYLSQAMVAYYAGDKDALSSYSETALARVWGAIRFSWWFTTLMHRFPKQSDLEQKLQESDLAYLETSVSAQTSMAEQYVGMPF